MKKIFKAIEVMIVLAALAIIITNKCSTERNVIGYDFQELNDSISFGNTNFENRNTNEMNNIDTTNKASSNRKKKRQISNDIAIIDYTNVSEGFVAVQYKAETDKRIKVTVENSKKKRYTYNIKPGKWELLSFSEGSDTYVVTIYQQVYDITYQSVLKKKIKVKLENELLPFLKSNQYVNLKNADKTIKKANQLTKYAETDIEKISFIYNYVVSNLFYDDEKAKIVQSDYLTDLDTILENKKGICLDYAALLVGMLRSQNIPSKIVVGYSEKTYHAWVSVYIKEDVEGICGNITYDEEHWLHMDPTCASANNNSKVALKYINSKDNYIKEYVY